MAVLVSYDVESGSVGEAIGSITKGTEVYEKAMDATSASKALDIISEIHSKYEAPFTTFVTGKTLLQNLEGYKKATNKLGKLIDVEQHTFSHVQFKDVVWSPSRGRVNKYPAGTVELLRQEVKSANEAVKSALGLACKGIRTPYCQSRTGSTPFGTRNSGGATSRVSRNSIGGT